MEKAEERESKAQLLAKDLKTLQAENKSLVKKFTQSNKTWWLYRWQPSTKLSINRVWLKIRSGDIASLHKELSSSIEKFFQIWNQVTELFWNYSNQFSIIQHNIRFKSLQHHHNNTKVCSFQLKRESSFRALVGPKVTIWKERKLIPSISPDFAQKQVKRMCAGCQYFFP